MQFDDIFCILHRNDVGVMKMENIVPRLGIQPTFLVFQANVLTISPCYRRLPVYLACEVSADYWNDLLECVVIAEIVNCFKSQLEDAYWSSITYILEPVTVAAIHHI